MSKSINIPKKVYQERTGQVCGASPTWGTRSKLLQEDYFITFINTNNNSSMIKMITRALITVPIYESTRALL